jgi:hypothetical protein
MNVLDPLGRFDRLGLPPSEIVGESGYGMITGGWPCVVAVRLQDQPVR